MKKKPPFPPPLVDAEQEPISGWPGPSDPRLSEHTWESVQAGSPANIGAPMRLNLGCGRNKIDGFVNVDIAQEGHDPDVILNLNEANTLDWINAFGVDIDPATGAAIGVVEYAQLIHVLEHIPNHLQMMENLWHVMKPGGLVYIRCPHGASDDAYEDPTHVLRLFPGSFMYYAQPTYWRADYGYRGDFEVVKCDLLMRQPIFAQKASFASMSRNTVQEIIVTMVCVKPARPNLRELLGQYKVRLLSAEIAQSDDLVQEFIPDGE